MFADTPAPHGATKVQYGSNQPYVHQPYPSVRFHPDGRTVTVRDEEEDRALGKPWANKPYPPVPVVARPPEPTVEELKAQVALLTKENADLKASLAERTQDSADQRSAGKKSKAAKPE